MTVRLNTNGMLLTEDRILSLKEAGVTEFQISLHSRRSTIRCVRTTKGAFGRVTEGIVSSDCHGLFVTARLYTDGREYFRPVTDVSICRGMLHPQIQGSRACSGSGIHEEAGRIRTNNLRNALSDLAKRHERRRRNCTLQTVALVSAGWNGPIVHTCTASVERSSVRGLRSVKLLRVRSCVKRNPSRLETWGTRFDGSLGEFRTV